MGEVVTRLAASRTSVTSDQSSSVFGAPRVAYPPRSVSILINNYNYGQFVSQAIESALAQTVPAQVVVVDDGSNDNSREVISRYADRVEAVFQDNGGQGAAMNEGFGRATGDLVIFLDSDDFLETHAVETLLKGWKASTVLAQYPLVIVDTDGIPCGVHPDPPETGLAEGDVRPALLETGGFAVNVTSGLAFSRNALLEVMPIPVRSFKNAADGYLVRGVAFKGNIQRFDDRLGSYRKHGRNDSDVCATPGGMADGFRKKIRYAEGEFATTCEFAKLHGLTVISDLGERDAAYLGYRLFSVLLEPDSHPIRNDRRWTLLSRYMAARWRSSWPVHRRMLAIALAALATVSPTSLSAVFIRWLHDSGSRPSWFRALAPKRA